MNLSIITPVYNELDQLPRYLDMLSRQESVDLELVLVDGGSDDGTAEYLQQLSATYRWPMRVLQTNKGRACQLNLGATAAQTETLLFLHVDSHFTDVNAICSGLEFFELSLAKAGHDKIAGHFRLKFSRTDESPSFGFYFWECKARLDRPECTHGDQGFLLRKSFYLQVGPFDDDAPIAEDTRLAERIRSVGSWVLLPAEIWTSARRFEVEGLKERQTLNALIMNFAAIKWDSFFLRVNDVYKNQGRTERLDLPLYFALIDQLNHEASFSTRLSTWYRTGVYVRPNAWQLAFLFDVKRNYRRHVAVDQVATPRLNFHDSWFDLVTDNLLGRFIAMVGTWVWYRWTVRHYSQIPRQN